MPKRKYKVWSPLILQALLLVCMFVTTETASAATATQSQAQADNGTRVLEEFDRQQVQKVDNAGGISNHEKQVIIFSLGVPLAILLLITGGLGIATGIYGKQLYIQHMIFAGLTITLAFAHVIVGLVWFNPF